MNLAKRLALPELTDKASVFERLFEADCPPKGSSVSDAIACRLVNISKAMQSATSILQKDKTKCFDCDMALINDKVFIQIYMHDIVKSLSRNATTLEVS